ncbi:hypothetical protein KCP69_04405 [Salmonella enterica subsp. enterica]|nr:hypothetical protein KCP69_04405 [Salmonella enterica subsp. enterica]
MTITEHGYRVFREVKPLADGLPQIRRDYRSCAFITPLAEEKQVGTMAGKITSNEDHRGYCM